MSDWQGKIASGIAAARPVLPEPPTPGIRGRAARALLGISRRSMKLARRIHPGIVEELKISNEAIRVFKAIHERNGRG